MSRLLPLLCCAGALSAPVAGALTINATFGSGFSADQEGAINAGIAEYEADISSNVSVDIAFDTMTTGLGQNSNTNYVGVSYSNFMSALKAGSSGDATDQYVGSLSGTINPQGLAYSTVFMTNANARALGYSVAGGNPDSTVSLNVSQCYTRSTGIVSNQYDLQSVAMHEIDEVLGSSSVLSAGSATPTSYTNPADLFRFADTTGTTHSFTTSTAATAYLVIDGTMLARYNQDGSGDYGDYVTGATPKVQDAYGTPGVNIDLSSSELTLLDAIGYTLTAVPEPSAYGFMGAGIPVIAAVVRRCRKKAGALSA